MKSEPTLRFLPLSDGKTPLFMWLIIPIFKIFKDPLFAGRFVSVLASVGTVVGIYLVGRELFGRKASVFSTIVYLVSPFFINW